MSAGRLLGIARKPRPRGEVETLAQVHVGLATGVAGDFRGAILPGRSNRRQVTVLAAEAWEAALGELGAEMPWTARRANLLVAGVALPRAKGARIRIGEGVLLEVTGECDPCSRMEEAAIGLKAALTPEWRGGVTATVIAEGDITVGDAIVIELTEEVS